MKMARTTHEAAREYDNQGTFDIFVLENDQDAKKVQFMINSTEDILAYTYHGIGMQSARGIGYERKVSCLKTSKDDPMGTCPLCDGGDPGGVGKIKTARFIPLYSVDENKVLLWERGAKFIDNTVKGFINRMVANGRSLPSLVVEIVRNGKKGDQQTTYVTYPLENYQSKDIADLDIPDPEGSLIAKWTKQDMQQYLRDGTIPNPAAATTNAGVQRRESRVEPESRPGKHAEDAAPIDTSRGTAVTAPEDYF